jgi:hypothetical protein
LRELDARELCGQRLGTVAPAVVVGDDLAVLRRKLPGTCRPDAARRACDKDAFTT